MTPEKRAEIQAKLDNVMTDAVSTQLDDEVAKGNFKEAAKIVKNVSKEVEKILASYGIVKISGSEPTFFAKVWSFILKWFLFGWIWMK